MPNQAIRAVLWDFGGVITDSPFDAFNRFEAKRGLPRDFIRTVNTVNPDTNAWALYERSQISLEEFDQAFAAESRAAGHAVRGADIARLLYGPIRPAMVEALQRCKPHFKNACLTNNVVTSAPHGLPTTDDRADQVIAVMRHFDHVIESSKVGARKPEARFYEIALERIGVTAAQAVFLDDLGINLKPARAMGMTTIKVTDPDLALQELSAILGLPLRIPV